jgi:hypothetical protein
MSIFLPSGFFFSAQIADCINPNCQIKRQMNRKMKFFLIYIISSGLYYIWITAFSGFPLNPNNADIVQKFI